LNARAAKNAIETLVSKDNGITIERIGQTLSALLSLGAANFENIGEVGVILKRENEVGSFKSVVADANMFVAATMQQELRTKDMHRSPRQIRIGRTRLRRIDIRYVHGEKCVIFSDRGTQQQWLKLIQSQAEARQVPAFGVEEAETRCAKMFDVAEAIGNEENIAVFEHARAVVRERGRSSNVVLIGKANDVRQTATVLKAQARLNFGFADR
jgi:erythromycin esterase-like protein